MKEELITVDGWDWCIDDPSRLEPWFRIREDAEKRFFVRREDSVSIFKIADAAGRNYFVRHETPDSIAKHVKAWFGSQAEDLYRASKILAAHKIPTVRFPGWGKCGTETMVLADEIPDAVTALEYWFRAVPRNHVLRVEFVSKLSDLIGLYYTNSLVQKDLSLQNILVRNDGSEMMAVNASDVEEREGGFSREDKIALIRPFVEMRGELSADNATIAILDSGIAADSQEAAELWDTAVDAMDDYVENELWQEIEEDLLSAESTPYCRLLPLENGGVLHVRNTIWHDEMPAPDDSNSFAEEVSEEEAKKIWLNSLKIQLMRDPIRKLPVSWEHYDDGRKDIIRYSAASDTDCDAGYVIQ